MLFQRTTHFLPLFLPAVLGYAYFLLHYRSPAYGLGGALVLATGAWALLRWDSVREWPVTRWAPLLACLALPLLGFWQYLQLQDIGDLDHASYANALWNFRHGRLDYSFERMNMLGIHSQYTSLFWIPLHALAGEAGLKIGEALCLISAAVLIALRWRHETRTVPWVMAAVLLSPALASQFFFGFHPEFIGAPVLVLALHAYRDGKLARFLSCVAFLSFSKEVYTLAVAGLLLVALVERRHWKWIVLPAALCILQMALYWYCIMPIFAPKGNFLRFFFPSSPIQILSLWFNPATARYAFQIALPCLPLLLLLPKRYLLLPIPLLAFYAAFPDPLFRVVWPNYAFLPVLMCLGGAVLVPVPRSGPENPKSASLAGGKPFFACVLNCVIAYPLWLEVLSVPPPDPERRKEMRTLEALVPKGASLLIHAGYTARFAARREFALWGQRSVWGPRPAPPEHYDYVLLEGRFQEDWLTDPADLRSGIRTLAASPQWTTVYSKHDTWLFRRTSP